MTEHERGDGQAEELTPGEAFRLLGEETRLKILLKLWEAHDPDNPDVPVAFSDLRKRVGVRDSGQFNYHLGKLTNHYVRSKEDGYILRQAGLKFVRSVIASTGDRSLDRTVIDETCPFCGAPKVITYEDAHLYLVCNECEGAFRHREDLPYGTLSAIEFEPSGLAGRTPEAVYAAANIATKHVIQLAVAGVCNECYGRMESRIEVCEDHGDGGMCQHCGLRFRVVFQFRCAVCKNQHTAPPRTVASGHPAVVSFCYDHGLSLSYDADDFTGLMHATHALDDFEEELVSTDPPLVRVTYYLEGDSLALIVDGSASVTEVTGPVDGTDRSA